jgi:hypothetical protein
MSINYTITEEDHTVTYTVEEGIGATGSDANVTNANVNLAISDDPAATRSALEIPINNFTASSAPTANDDETEGYSQGSKWYGGGEAYLCVDPTEGAAVWVKTTLTADELGDAAFKDTGSTAGTVAAGDDSRLSDARTPTAHASTHVTGGADKIRDASAAQDGLMTTAFAAKLDGIAANANNYVHPNHSGDVTSVSDGATTIANNAVTFAKMQDVSGTVLVGRHAGGSGDPQEVSVGNGVEFSGSGIRRSALTGDVTASAGSNTTTLQGSAVAARINGADSKTTPVDADELGIADSAAAFGLKKVTFGNLWTWVVSKIGAITSITASGAWAFSSTTRPTSGGTGTPEATSLITRADGDARYGQVFFTSGELATDLDTAQDIAPPITDIPVGTYALTCDIYVQTANTETIGVTIACPLINGTSARRYRLQGVNTQSVVPSLAVGSNDAGAGPIPSITSGGGSVGRAFQQVFSLVTFTSVGTVKITGRNTLADKGTTTFFATLNLVRKS